MTDADLAAGLVANLARVRARRSLEIAAGVAAALAPGDAAVALMRAAGVPEAAIAKAQYDAFVARGKGGPQL